MTSRTRNKRCTKIKVKERDENGNIIEKSIIVPDECLDAPIGDEENFTLGETIANDFTIEKELFERDEKEYSEKMLLYLSRLSDLQKEIFKVKL